MYVKLFQQILDSSIADNRPLRHFFIDLLLCSDARGYVIMTKEAIARRIAATVEEVEWGISELMKPDPGSKTPEADGARLEPLDGMGYGWRIVNYDLYRAMKDADQMREAAAERVRRFRAKKRGCNVTETKCNAGNAITEAEAEAEGGERPPARTTPNRRGMNPPTLEKATAYGASVSVPSSTVEKWWYKRDRQGWETGTGRMITNWQSDLMTWHLDEQNRPKPASQRSASPFGGGVV